MLTQKIQSRRCLRRGLILGGILLFSTPEESYGVPYFARQNGVTCSACHVIPPKLNQGGENFRANGYKLPDAGPEKRTWPFALWFSYRGEAQTSKDLNKTLPNKVELISGGTIGNTPLSYFLEWRILSLQSKSDGTLKDRSGRFEDLFVSLEVSNFISLRAGQYRLLNQIDNSLKLGLSTPLVIGAGIAGSPASNSRKTSLRKFSPQGRSPAVSFQVHSLKGENAADGWFNVVSLPFPGELSIPLTEEARDEASFEVESDPKGVFLESFYRLGLSSVGAHLFLDDGRSMGSFLAGLNRERWFSTFGVGFGRVDGKTDTRVSWMNEFILHKFFSIQARIDHQTNVTNGTTFAPSVNLQGPGTQWTLFLVVEQRIRTDNHATFAEFSLLF